VPRSRTFQLIPAVVACDDLPFDRAVSPALGVLGTNSTPIGSGKALSVPLNGAVKAGVASD